MEGVVFSPPFLRLTTALTMANQGAVALWPAAKGPPAQSALVAGLLPHPNEIGAYFRAPGSFTNGQIDPGPSRAHPTYISGIHDSARSKQGRYELEVSS
ncbi:hypothetical protein Sjap_014764 [Stephania japonica]|uniref:Uncharacterized protein n=1 Tax=Stephania japonica TaxID=461633 RepID=A0AAP0IJS8_9MAGN